jgi:hypothetical protein
MRTLFLGLTLLLAVSIPNWTPTAAAQNYSARKDATKTSGFKAGETRKIETYLRKLFGNQRIRLVSRPNKPDSAEVYIAEEFIGVVFVDDEDADRSFQFQMAILEDDLK